MFRKRKFCGTIFCIVRTVKDVSQRVRSIAQIVVNPYQKKLMILINIRVDLIEKQLQSGCTNGLTFKKFALSQRFIDWLFAKYKTEEFSIHFYDDEPDVPDEWDQDGDEWDDPEFKEVWKKLVEEYEPRRIEFNNWIDPFAKGIWGMNQEEVDKISIENMEEILTYDVDMTDRLYISFKKDGHAFIYWYGRDFHKSDLWWIMSKR